MIEITDVPSPFCGIGTDDLRIQIDGSTLKVLENGCAVNTPLFEQPITDTSPRVAGQRRLCHRCQRNARLTCVS